MWNKTRSYQERALPSELCGPGLEANSTVMKMKSQPVEHVLLQKTFSLGSLRSLAEGYILNCRCESKSTATIASYQYRLASFIWYCQDTKFIIEEPGCQHIGKKVPFSL